MSYKEKPTCKTISVLGDSIANGYFDQDNLGWVVRLGQKLQDNNPGSTYIRNFAVAGDHITDCLARHRSQVVSNPGDCLVIACGANDMARWGNRDSPSSLSLAFCIKTWNELLIEAKEFFDLIYVCQILPVDETKIPARENEQGLDQFYRNDDISEYNEALKTLCSDHACHFVDFSSDLTKINWDNFLFDDIHPNAKGHKLIAERMYIEVKDMLQINTY